MCKMLVVKVKCLQLLCVIVFGVEIYGSSAQQNSFSLTPSPNQATGATAAFTLLNKGSGNTISVYFGNSTSTTNIIASLLPGSLEISQCADSRLQHIRRSCNITQQNNTLKLVVKFYNVLNNYSYINVLQETLIYRANFSVKDCPQNTTAIAPYIKSGSYVYGSKGLFRCNGKQELFYSNSTLGINDTTCQNDAIWYGSAGLECWTAPDVQLVGNFSGKAGSYLKLNCTFDETVWPVGNQCNITLNNVLVKTTRANQQFQFYLTRDMNGKTIAAQAITKYTKQRLNQGISSQQPLQVYFKPYKGTTTTNCIENQQCDIQVVSNPAPGNPFLVGPAMESFTWTVRNHPYYTFQITKPKGTYMFRVNNSVGEGMFNVTVDAKTPISPSNLALIIGASVAGVLVIAFVIILIVVIRRRNAGKSEQEERQNPIYGSSPNAVDNGTDYAQVQKKNKKNKKEMTENIAYQPASSPDAIEDAYASVSKNEKEVKMNILYGSSTGAHTSQVEDAYAEVDKGKKKKKDKTKAMKVNVAYVPTPENPDAPEEAYAEVNKDKKKKGKKGEREMKDNILYGSSQAGGSVEDAYAEVDKKKKKNAGAKQGEASSGATYSEVSKPKNKKKDKPSSSQTPDDDPYAEVDLHGQDSSNLE